MAASHTPGPWVIPSAQPTLVRTERGLAVADTYGNTILASEQEANARLIAAAPIMLEALKAAQAALAMLTEETSIKSSSVAQAWATAVQAERAVRSTIAFAEGRADV